VAKKPKFKHILPRGKVPAAAYQPEIVKHPKIASDPNHRIGPCEKD